MNIPCTLIPVFLVLIGRFSAHLNTYTHKPRFFKHVCELSCTLILTLLHIINFFVYISYENQVPIDLICYLTECMLAATLFINCFMNYSNRSAYFIRNSWDYIFWITYVLTFLPRLITILFNKDHSVPQYPIGSSLWTIVSAILRLIISSVLLVMKSFSNKTYPAKRIYTTARCNGFAYNPEPYSGILAMWTLNWLNPIIWKAFKGKISKIDDIFYVRPHESVNKSYKKLEIVWKKFKPKNLEYGIGSWANADIDQETSLHINEDTEQLLQNEPKTRDDSIEIRKASFALVKSLFSAFGSDLYIAWVLMIFEALMSYASPLLLSSMLAFLSQDSNDRVALYGYLICFGFPITSLMVTFAFHRGFFYTYHVGNRIRNSMVSLIYRKALVLSSAARNNYSAGELTNLATVDVDHLLSCASTLHSLFVVILQLCVASYLLYRQLGVAAFAGLAVVFASIPLNTFAGWISQTFEFKELAAKDKRMKFLSEVFNGIRMLKLYAWEPAFEKTVQKLRMKELKMLAGSLLGFAIMNISWSIFPFLVLIATLYTFLHRMVSGNHAAIDILTPERIFVSLTLFNLIRFPLLMLPWSLNVIFMAIASVKRLGKFLIASELDSAVVNHMPRFGSDEVFEFAIQFKNVSLNWRPDSKQNALKNIDFSIKHGSLIALVGPVGAGKSSIISAVLGEMYKTNGEIIVSGTIGYLSQTAWIQQHTVLGNVLFGSRWDPEWYFQVTEACALRSDIERMDQKDETIIGERGVNLSGGQKQRVNLARAVYQRRDIYLLDDPLSAVDAHVAKHIFNKVIGPKGLLGTKTRLVVTHSIHYLHHFDHILVLNTDGILIQKGTYKELMKSDEDFFRNYVKSIDVEKNTIQTSRERQVSIRSCYSNDLPLSCSPSERRYFVKKEDVQTKELVPHGFVHSNIHSCSAAANHLINLAGFEHTEVSTEESIPIKQNQELRGLPGTSHHESSASVGKNERIDDVVVRRRKFSIDENLVRKAQQKFSKSQKTGNSITKTEISADQQCFNSNRIRIPSVRFSLPVYEELSSPNRDCDPNNNYSDDEWGDNLENPVLEVIGDAISEEEIEKQGVSWKSYIAYFIARSIILLILILLFMCCFQGLEVFCTYWLQWFADDPQIANASRELKNPEITTDEKVKLVEEIYNISHWYLQYYGLIGLVMALVSLVFITLLNGSKLLASKRIHRKLLHRILRSPCSVFDKVPVGRILNRFGSDIETVDHTLPSSLQETTSTLLNTIIAVIVVVYSLKPFYFGILMIIPIGAVSILLQKLYLPCSRQARRLHSKTKSPILSCFSETAMNREGVNILRAFDKTPIFIRTFNRLINENASAWFLNYSMHRWLDIRLESLSAFFVFITSVSIVWHRDEYTAGMAGLMIVFALQCAECLTWLTKNTADVENSAVSLERVDEYSRFDQEADWVLEDSSPPVNWPKSYPEIFFDNVEIGYETSDKPALDNLSVRFGGSVKQRVIGIVGRTGAGKSTLAASLFRMVEPDQGKIFIDNLDISKIGLHDLRKRLRILPQEPMVFSGSLRMNLDPFDIYSDHKLWSALREAHLEEWAITLEAGLQFDCGEGGVQMSVGQRQLLCLARILLNEQEHGKNLNLLVLDEATSAMDPKTDQLVMQTVLDPMGKFSNSTIIIIAHRLSTIMSADLVLVMRDGQVAEYGPPLELLKDSNTIFSKMNADQSDVPN